MIEDHHFSCPYCDAPISMILDLSTGAQSYIEDCEVCCQPIELSFDVDAERLQNFFAGRADD